MEVKSGRAPGAKVGSLGANQKLADVVGKGRPRISFWESLRKDWLRGARDQVWEAWGPGVLRSCERCLPGR